MLNKRMGKIITLLGIMLIIVGFVYEGILAGVPYQDPTPAMLKEYYHYINIGDCFYKVGFSVLMVGVLIIIVRKINEYSCKQIK